MRLLTNNQPMDGASACKAASSSAYSFGSASGIVDKIWATFINGPFRLPKASRSWIACLPRFSSIPKYRSPASLAARPDIVLVTWAYLRNLPPILERSSLSAITVNPLPDLSWRRSYQDPYSRILVQMGSMRKVLRHYQI